MAYLIDEIIVHGSVLAEGDGGEADSLGDPDVRRAHHQVVAHLGRHCRWLRVRGAFYHYSEASKGVRK